MKNFHPPKPFLILLDREGNSIETLPRNISMEDIVRVVQQKDRQNSWAAPHSVQIWNGQVWFPFNLPTS